MFSVSVYNLNFVFPVPELLNHYLSSSEHREEFIQMIRLHSILIMIVQVLEYVD